MGGYHRHLRGGGTYISPAERIEIEADYYRIGRWTNQPNYVEVWVEKDAMVEIVGKACNKTDTPFFSCRGYCSQSEMWQAAQRFIRRKDREGRYIIYLGDHDPSGIDMTRDIADRLDLFGANVEVQRIALTMEQINAFNPPPNFAKITDSRAGAYIKAFGKDSWELDALEPQFVTNLIDSHVRALMDDSILAEIFKLEREQRQQLKLVADNYFDVVSYLQSC